MKKFAFAFVLGLSGLGASTASVAATTAANFNVNITLNAKCVVSTAATNINLTYTAFAGGAASTGASNVGVSCTKSLPYALSLDTPVQQTGMVYTYTDATTNLSYDLTLPTGPFTGTGAAVTHTINAAMPQNQDATATCTAAGGVCTSTNARTLTITY